MSGISPLFKKAMDELEVSFLINNRVEDLQDPSFLCNQLQLAHYRYIDYWRVINPELPELPDLEDFMRELFAHSSVFAGNDPEELVKYYKKLRSKIPVCGCIILNHDLNKIVLCRDLNTRTWMLPAGKIDEGESLHKCAVRETYEESGFDAAELINPNQCLQTKVGTKMIYMFVITNVSESFKFSPKCKGEIDLVKFFPVSKIPENTFRVREFIPLIEKWVANHKSGSKETRGDRGSSELSAQSTVKNDSNDSNRSSSNSKQRSSNDKARSNSNMRSETIYDDETTFEGNNSKGWSTSEMFAAVKSATGRSIEYSGNPNDFEGHPMYRNYNAIAKIEKSNSAQFSKDEIFDFDQLSAQSSSFDNFKKDEKSGKIEYNTPFVVDIPPPAPPKAAVIEPAVSQRKLDVNSLFKKSSGEGSEIKIATKPGTIEKSLVSLEKDDSVNLSHSSYSISGGFEIGFKSINESTLAELLIELNPNNVNSLYKRSSNIKGDPNVTLESLLLAHFA